MVKRIGISACTALFFIFCGTTTATESEQTIRVEFEWTEASRCSTVSPLIRVADIPEGTKYFKVKLVDLNMPAFDHGGGLIPYSGTAVISEGALEAYRGPCPFTGMVHSYEISVQALSSDKKEVLGHGKAVRKFSY